MPGARCREVPLHYCCDPFSLLPMHRTRWILQYVIRDRKPIDPTPQRLRLADANSPFATLSLRSRDAADGLLLCYGGMTRAALEVAAALRAREDLDFGLVIVWQLAPTPAAHLDAILSDAAPTAIVAPRPIAYRRVGAKGTPIPSARAVEDGWLPQAEDIVAAVLECF